jgi:hypothetical protein
MMNWTSTFLPLTFDAQLDAEWKVSCWGARRSQCADRERERKVGEICHEKINGRVPVVLNIAEGNSGS